MTGIVTEHLPKAVENSSGRTVINYRRFTRSPPSTGSTFAVPNGIESVFATVRWCTYKTKGIGTHRATLAMAFKLVPEAQKTSRMIAKWQQLELVQAGRAFRDRVLVEDSAA